MSDIEQAPRVPKVKLFETKRFMYVFMFSIILYVLVCGYVLIFSGSLFWEAMANGWYSVDSNAYDQNSFLLGFLYGFPSLCGVVGGILVLATRAQRLFRFKVLLLVPAADWAVLLVLGNLRWGLTYWTEWLYLVPIMTLCIFALYGVVKKVHLPIYAPQTAETPEPA